MLDQISFLNAGQAVLPSHSVAAGPAVLAAAGTGLMAVATVVGACLARSRAGQHRAWYGAAAGALLAIAGVHLLPDAWQAASGAGNWQWAVPAVAAAAFMLTRLVARHGCACVRDAGHPAGASAATALVIHRVLEGAALVLIGSATIAAALAVHSFGEGLALGALLRTRSRRSIGAWLGAMCVSPVAGALISNAVPVPAALRPWLLALGAGVLAQAAVVSLQAAGQHLSPGKFAAAGPAMATTMTAAVTILAIHALG